MAGRGDLQFVDDGDGGTYPVVTRASRAPWVLLAVTLLAGIGGAGWLFLQLVRARDDAASASAGLRDARAQLDAGRTEREELEHRLARADSDRADLAAAKDALSHDVAAKDQELAKLHGEMGELQDKMKAEIEKGNVRLTQEKGRIKVDMVDEVLFDVGDSTISRQGEEVLARVGGVLAHMADKRIQVSGHTDDLPISKRLVDRFPTNWELSSARALTVVRFLEERAGIPGRRLVAAAHSQFDPISPNKTAAGRARNRRIEILLTPELERERVADGAAPAAPPSAAAGKPSAAKVHGTAPAKATKVAAAHAGTAKKHGAARAR